jgi:hypothetical protein
MLLGELRPRVDCGMGSCQEGREEEVVCEDRVGTLNGLFTLGCFL